MVELSKGNFPNPFGVRRAPSEPASVISVVKIPRQNLTSQTIPNPPLLSNFLSLFSNGDSPPHPFLHRFLIVLFIGFGSFLCRAFCVNPIRRL